MVKEEEQEEYPDDFEALNDKNVEKSMRQLMQEKTLYNKRGVQQFISGWEVSH